MHRIAILTGGSSSEREIALRSAASVRDWVSARYEIGVFDLPADLDRFLDGRSGWDAAIPVFHGKGGEDGTIQGFLKTLDIPFIFSDIEAHAIGMDKIATKTLLSAAGIPTPAARVIRNGEPAAFERPCVVKIPDAGSSVGVFLAPDEQAFRAALEHGSRMSAVLLVEDLVTGREFTVPVVEYAGDVRALPVVEIRSKNAFFDRESKYDPALADETCPAQIPRDLTERLQQLAVRCHQAIGARHVSRTDIIVDDAGRPWFLEINTIPGMTDASLLPRSVAAAGLTMAGLFDGWIGSVMRRAA